MPRINEAYPPQLELICGLTGAQIQAMQGGKLHNAENFAGPKVSSAERQEYKKKEQLQREEFNNSVTEVARCHPVLTKLLTSGVSNSCILQAAKEFNEEKDDFLIFELARIHNIAII